ncbi:MAG: ABC transporter substrate-binding protein [Deltaproteobacteria bacterium]|nr:ABC transporter substrate-binding protein [Deltaproteobacteria bacterium]
MKLKSYVCILLACCLSWAAVDVASQEREAQPQPALVTPREEMSKILDQLVDIAEAHPGDKNLEVRKTEMRKVIEPKFDFQQMSQLSLGSQWSSLSAQDRAEFVKVFSDLLAKTYLSKISVVTRGMVRISGDRVRENRALVRTMVTFKGDEFPLDYKLVNRGGEWKVYDVIIENIGLVVNYRNEFAGIIRKEKFDGLMKRLREKLAKPEESK